ncbi:MAG: RNA polymerase sigma factor [Egibacteraceae bacterium]
MTAARGHGTSIAWVVALFDAHADGVFTLARRMLWNTADGEDVVQRTFVRAFTRGHQLRDASKARSWIYRIAYHECLTVLRERRDIPTDPALLPEREAPDRPDREVERRQLALRLRAAIDTLPPTLRPAFVLRDVQGVPMTEVAAVLDVGLSTAKMRVHRARLRLRELLDEEDRRALR